MRPRGSPCFQPRGSFTGALVAQFKGVRAVATPREHDQSKPNEENRQSRGLHPGCGDTVPLLQWLVPFIAAARSFGTYPIEHE